jgi:hypothetical protein
MGAQSQGSLFRPFPQGKGPVKLLLYGDPGTEKTRRALRMPGPIYVIDMENGSADYGDLVDPKRDRYLSTKSHVEVMAALKEIGKLKPEEVGTVIIDPITVIWQSIQVGHIERVMSKGYWSKGRLIKPESAEEVPFEVGTWGKLKRTYGDILSTLISSHYHVVMIARGKEKTNEKGEKIGYGYEGEKSTEFLAKTVISTHLDGDVVLKDRSGTWRESGAKRPRVVLGELVKNSTRSAQAMQTDTEASRVDAEEDIAGPGGGGGGQQPQPTASTTTAENREERHHESWAAGRAAFCAKLAEMGLKYEDVADFCAQYSDTHSKGQVWGRPSWWPAANRRNLVTNLEAGKALRQDFDAWLSDRNATEPGAGG